jgi:ribose 5-phosphate isomerase A
MAGVGNGSRERMTESMGQETGVQEQKRAAAVYAATLVEDGMIVGLGSGSTAELWIQEVGRRVQAGLQLIGVPTSVETARLAASIGISLSTLEQHHRLDLTVDGADEVDPGLNLIKGRGGALLREKIVARAAERFVVVVDASKRVPRLGEHAPVPVEVVPFGWTSTRLRLEHLGLVCTLRGGSNPFRTDGGNYILDCQAPSQLGLASRPVADGIKLQTGVLDHGLFLNMATTVIVGSDSGGVEVLNRQGTHTA